MIRLRKKWLAVVNTVMNHRLPQNAGNFLSSWGNVSFWRRAVLYGVQLVIGRETNDKSQHKDELNTLLESAVFMLLSKYAAVRGQTEARKLLTKRDNFLHADVKHNSTPLVGRLSLKYDGARIETIFRLSAKRTTSFKSAGASVQSTTSSRGVRIYISNAGYTTFRGSVKGTVYPLHSSVSPFTSLPVRNRVPSHFNWTLKLHTTTTTTLPNYKIHNSVCITII